MQKINVLMVCLGNICRSPTAHGVFRDLIDQAQLQQSISVDSAGTAGWHEGHSPDPRSQATAKQYGVDITDLQARPVTKEDFSLFDYILAMDTENLANLEALKPANFSGQLCLLLDFIETDLIS